MHIKFQETTAGAMIECASCCLMSMGHEDHHQQGRGQCCWLLSMQVDN